MSSNKSNLTGCLPEGHQVNSEDWVDDATWILTSAFIIFTMQSGFGLLESGMASKKNEVNIMIKNVVDVVFGGLTYWSIGYGLTFGDDERSNGFTGSGSFFLDPDEEHMGTEFSKFVFQASFCTTATTIVSGALAERTKLSAYIVYCLMNTFVYSFPAHWIWAENGWLKRLHVVDVAGVGPVHLVGGMSALVAAIMVKPRHARFADDKPPEHGNSVNAILGLFILWWGWLGFNCGSTFGISGGKWKLAARSAATTILASCSGGAIGFIISFIVHKRKFDVHMIVNSILGALVAITGICAVTTTWASVIIGAVGAMVTIGGQRLLIKLKVDDPVGASAVHFIGSIWGMLCCGIFAQKDNIENSFSHHNGLVWEGGFYLLGVQTLATVVIILWTIVTSFTILKVIDLTIGLRVSLEHELYGADYCEHMVPLAPDVKAHADFILSQIKEEDKKNLDTSKNLRNRIKRVLCCKDTPKNDEKYTDSKNKTETDKIDTDSCKTRTDSGIVEDKENNEPEGVDNIAFTD